MNTSSSDDPTPAAVPATAHHPAETPSAEASQHPDPITGEPGAHPVGVGVGAIGAGIAGAAIGAVAGPIGVLIGAAIGAVAGGLAGKEVAEADDAPVPPSDSAPARSALESMLPVEGMANASAGGVPASTLTGFPGMTSPASNLETAAEDETAASRIADDPETAAGSFHDAFTATTFRETEAENRIADEDDTALDLQPPSLSPQGGDAVGMQEHIRTAAYFRYLDRQAASQPGDAFGDWVEAEWEVLNR